MDVPWALPAVAFRHTAAAGPCDAMEAPAYLEPAAHQGAWMQHPAWAFPTAPLWWFLGPMSPYARSHAQIIPSQPLPPPPQAQVPRKARLSRRGLLFRWAITTVRLRRLRNYWSSADARAVDVQRERGREAAIHTAAEARRRAHHARRRDRLFLAWRAHVRAERTRRAAEAQERLDRAANSASARRSRARAAARATTTLSLARTLACCHVAVRLAARFPVATVAPPPPPVSPPSPPRAQVTPPTGPVSPAASAPPAACPTGGYRVAVIPNAASPDEYLDNLRRLGLANRLASLLLDNRGKNGAVEFRLSDSDVPLGRVGVPPLCPNGGTAASPSTARGRLQLRLQARALGASAAKVLSAGFKPTP